MDHFNFSPIQTILPPTSLNASFNLMSTDRRSRRESVHISDSHEKDCRTRYRMETYIEEHTHNTQLDGLTAGVSTHSTQVIETTRTEKTKKIREFSKFSNANNPSKSGQDMPEEMKKEKLQSK